MFKQDNLKLTIPKSGDIRTLISELIYYSELLGIDIIVPKEFKTDLGSIPQFLQGIFPKDGKATFGYIIHDYLYKIGLHSQSICDDVLEECMKELEVKWWRRKSVRNGLRIGGFLAYKKHRKNDKNFTFTIRDNDDGKVF